jgi:CubicO group peptidase (beta-lactamase class C family)
MVSHGNRLLILFCMVFICTVASQRTAFAELLETSEIDRAISEGLLAFDIPGMAIAIVENDSVAYLKGFGVRTVGKPGTIDEHTVFAIGSDSKAFTATALGMLVADGLISFDDPLALRLPGFRVDDPYVSQQVTIRDALAHRSGLKQIDEIWYQHPERTRMELLEKMSGLEQELGFRSGFLYNNLMYLAAGEVIPATTGISWDDFLEQRIFTPLKMVDTNTSTSRFQQNANLASPHERSNGELRPVPWRNLDNVAPAGAINSSASDMAQWCRLQNNKGHLDGVQIVPEFIQAEIHSPQTLVPVNPQNPTGYGTVYNSYTLGWGRQDYRGAATMLTHTGSIDGMFSMISQLPDQGLCIVMLANSSDANALQIVTMNTIFDRYLNLEPMDWPSIGLGYKEYKTKQAQDTEQELKASRVEGTSPTRALDVYAGLYVHPMFGELLVTLEKGLLVIDQGPLFHGSMDHWQYDSFRIRWEKTGAEDGGISNFTLGTDGQPDALIIHVPSDSEPIRYQRANSAQPG